VLLTALPALLSIPDAQITIVGTGPESGRLARAATDRVKLLGVVTSRESLARIYGERRQTTEALDAVEVPIGPSAEPRASRPLRAAHRST
jgi:hypothetical protein